MSTARVLSLTSRSRKLTSLLSFADHKCWTTDVCVPISALPLLVEETKADLLERGLTACHVGHVGDGNVHSLILFKDDKELERVKEAVQ